MYEFMIFCNYIYVLENCNKKMLYCVFFFFFVWCIYSCENNYRCDI